MKPEDSSASGKSGLATPNPSRSQSPFEDLPRLRGRPVAETLNTSISVRNRLIWKARINRKRPAADSPGKASDLHRKIHAVFEARVIGLAKPSSNRFARAAFDVCGFASISNVDKRKRFGFRLLGTISDVPLRVRIRYTYKLWERHGKLRKTAQRPFRKQPQADDLSCNRGFLRRVTQPAPWEKRCGPLLSTHVCSGQETTAAARNSDKCHNEFLQKFTRLGQSTKLLLYFNFKFVDFVICTILNIDHVWCEVPSQAGSCFSCSVTVWTSTASGRQTFSRRFVPAVLFHSRGWWDRFNSSWVEATHFIILGVSIDSRKVRNQNGMSGKLGGMSRGNHKQSDFSLLIGL